ncbi:MAG: twin-arginine translocase TatA/TatE family subunit [Gaiellaceae bacterium]
MPGFVGLPELIVLGLVLLLIFGPKRLPEMGRSLGHGMREFKDSVTGSDRDKLELPEPAPRVAAARPATVSTVEAERRA